jgi:hypothetical protein
MTAAEPAFVNYLTCGERGLGYDAPRGGGRWRPRMDAIADLLYRATGRDLEDETVQTTIIFCGIGLFVSLLFVAYGLNLCPRFF